MCDHLRISVRRQFKSRRDIDPLMLVYNRNIGTALPVFVIRVAFVDAHPDCRVHKYTIPIPNRIIDADWGSIME